MEISDIEGNIGRKKYEDGYPIYYTDTGPYCEAHRVVMIDDLYKMPNINTEMILSKWQAKYYHFFETYNELAFTLDAFIDKFFAESDFISVDDNKVDNELKIMVKEGLLKGVYYKGHYYYHF
ncbi:MAG: hypothetical protein ACFFAO_22075 [Candidatus Hermodarchaeota archaeon]